jgi:hypothetical protein
MKITPQQVATIARALADVSDVTHVDVKTAPGFDRVDYQFHYRGGTFSSHVIVRRDGTIV